MQKVCVEHECKWIRRAKTKPINKIVALNVEWIVVMVTCLNGLLNLLFFAPTRVFFFVNFIQSMQLQWCIRREEIIKQS